MKNISLLVVTAIFAVSPNPLPAALTSARPNFVVFISDDHSQLDSQAYGSKEVRKPLLHNEPVTLITPGAKR